MKNQAKAVLEGKVDEDKRNINELGIEICWHRDSDSAYDICRHPRCDGYDPGCEDYDPASRIRKYRKTLNNSATNTQDREEI